MIFSKFSLTFCCASLLFASSALGIEIYSSDNTNGESVKGRSDKLQAEKTTGSSVEDDKKIDKTGIKINGMFEFQSGFRFQGMDNEADRFVSNKNKRFALYSRGGIVFHGYRILNDLEYGIKLILVPTSLRIGGASWNGSNLYIQGDYGRIELGCPVDAAGSLILTGPGLNVAGGHWSRYAKSGTSKMKQFGIEPSFEKFYDFFLDDKLATGVDDIPYSKEPSRRISYYSPSFDLGESTELKFGVSYTPDSSNTGAADLYKNSNKKNNKKYTYKNEADVDVINEYKIDESVKNAFSGGVSITHNISDGVDLKVSCTGEIGDSAGSIVHTKTIAGQPDEVKTYKLSNLRTFNIGAQLDYGVLSFGASYGSLCKSLTAPEYNLSGRKTNYFGVGARYSQGPFRTSLTYFKSDKFKNTTDLISLSGDYKLASGITPYAGLYFYRFKGKPEMIPNLTSRSAKGFVAVIGTKISF